MEDLLAKTQGWRRKIKRGNLIAYGSLFVGMLFAYHLVSDGDFSFLMTLGAVLRMAGFGVLLWKVYTSRSVSGVSLKTLTAYSLVFFFRLWSILFHEGYLPFDRSGDWFYPTVEIVALCLSLALIALTVTQFHSTYEAQDDVFGNLYVPSKFGVVYLVCPTLLLAMIFHPTLNNFFISDVAWTFALYLESVAVLPQLFMFQRKSSRNAFGDVDQWVSHVVFLLGAARVMLLLFWAFSFRELNNDRASHIGHQFPGYFVLFAQCMQLLLMIDFIWYYVKTAMAGEKMALPGGL
jgi:hypothetical protein